jgi:hypothetical protein
MAALSSDSAVELMRQVRPRIGYNIRAMIINRCTRLNRSPPPCRRAWTVMISESRWGRAASTRSGAPQLQR